MFSPLFPDPGSMVAWYLLSGTSSNIDGRGKRAAWPRDGERHGPVLPDPCQSVLLDKLLFFSGSLLASAPMGHAQLWKLEFGCKLAQSRV